MINTIPPRKRQKIAASPLALPDSTLQRLFAGGRNKHFISILLPAVSPGTLNALGRTNRTFRELIFSDVTKSVNDVWHNVFHAYKDRLYVNWEPPVDVSYLQLMKFLATLLQVVLLDLKNRNQSFGCLLKRLDEECRSNKYISDTGRPDIATNNFCEDFNSNDYMFRPSQKFRPEFIWSIYARWQYSMYVGDTKSLDDVWTDFSKHRTRNKLYANKPQELYTTRVRRYALKAACDVRYRRRKLSHVEEIASKKSGQWLLSKLNENKKLLISSSTKDFIRALFDLPYPETLRPSRKVPPKKVLEVACRRGSKNYIASVQRLYSKYTGPKLDSEYSKSLILACIGFNMPGLLRSADTHLTHPKCNDLHFIVGMFHSNLETAALESHVNSLHGYNIHARFLAFKHYFGCKMTEYFLPSAVMLGLTILPKQESPEYITLLLSELAEEIGGKNKLVEWVLSERGNLFCFLDLNTFQWLRPPYANAVIRYLCSIVLNESSATEQYYLTYQLCEIIHLELCMHLFSAEPEELLRWYKRGELLGPLYQLLMKLIFPRFNGHQPLRFTQHIQPQLVSCSQ